jgi:PKD repeat protein
MTRKSTLDSNYTTGALSNYPLAIDDSNTLYTATNNAQTVLTQSLSFNGTFIIVQDTGDFPAYGLIRVGTELIYYGLKTSGSFQNLQRGFAGSSQQQWLQGTQVSLTVEAEPHNAIKDAVINIESYLGLKTLPDANSLNGILTAQENKYLAPKPIFRGVPLIGPPPLKVRFQNFSNKLAVRFLWDFGDGGTSTDVSPIHTYLEEGVFTVQLKMVTTLKGQGIITKSGYVTVSKSLIPPFMYVQPTMGTTSTTFTFIDQTEGPVVSRYWIFGDGTTTTIDDPDIHIITHNYTQPGTYNASLLVVHADGTQAAVDPSTGAIIVA